MAESCSGCGSDFFPGQRFCRVCGRPTGDLIQGNAPTQMMSPVEASESGTRMMPPQPGGAQTGRVQGDTAPTGRPQTAQGYRQAVADYYQPSMQTPAPVYLPKKKSSPWGWILAFVGIGVFGFIVIAIIVAARTARNFSVRFPHNGSSGATQPFEGESAFDDTVATAQVSGEETALTKSFPLTNTGSFSLETLNGDVDIQAWDQPNAEVKVIESGSTHRRREAKVFYVAQNNKVAFRTGPSRGVTVRYEVKLPRQLAAVKIHGVSSEVQLSGVAADIAVDTTSGEISLSDVAGAVNANSVSGGVNASFSGQPVNKSLRFNTVSGGVNLTFKSDLDAMLDANTVSGDIDVDNAYGINVQEQIAHKHASGKIGTGAGSLSISTVSGGVSVKKAQQ